MGRLSKTDLSSRSSANQADSSRLCWHSSNPDIKDYTSQYRRSGALLPLYKSVERSHQSFISTAVQAMNLSANLAKLTQSVEYSSSKGLFGRLRRRGSCFAPRRTQLLHRISTATVAVVSFSSISNVTQLLPASASPGILLASNYCEGQSKEGLINGKGVCVFPSGNRYEGELRDSKRQGRGTFTFTNGTRCEGEFRNDLLNGRGVCIFPSGNRYEGDFRDNRREGRGVFTYQDGTRCEGDFLNNALTGMGVCTFPNRNRYEGAFQNNRKQGRGTFIFANGTRCEGEFRNDLLNGFGQCLFPNGNRYEGEFRDGRQNGRGTYLFSDGTRVDGTWREGRYISGNGTKRS